jgi:GTPase SAR1 family protein
VLVFDLCDRKSFDDVNQWLVDVHALCDPNAAMTLIGNKLDLVEHRKVTCHEAEAFARLHQLSYFETSALGGDHIQEAFHRTAAAILRRIKIEGSVDRPVYDSSSIRGKPTPCFC